ncbi:MAG TPA: hypothetical protein VMT53_00730 [Terriglobales bacterium]|nr:hypothetical protein [Terriglobales bacterium]
MAERADSFPFVRHWKVVAICLTIALASVSPVICDDQKAQHAKRPEVPWGATSLNPVQIGAYNSRAQSPAEALGALNELTLRGWNVIWKYYPRLGIKIDEGSASLSPRDPTDLRIHAVFSNEDPGRSPIPLISMICSLDPRDVTGKLRALRDELLADIRIEDYASWSLERLRTAVARLTQETTDHKGVKYRAPRKTLTFHESLELYAMTVELIARDDKWQKWQAEIKKLGYRVPVLPDMEDFSKRLRHQLPVMIPPGATRAFLLYRPGWDIYQPVTKGEYEERADVVRVRRSGHDFDVEQFPVYLTNDQLTWNPAWIESRDEERDSTLLARRFEEQWTRFDGPYLWPKRDILVGELNYRARVHFKNNDIVVEGERFVPRRGAVVKTLRDPSYDPLNMKPYQGGGELPPEALTADYPDLPDWAAVWKFAGKNLDAAVYIQGERQLFWYQTGPGAWTNSIYPRDNAGPSILRPRKPATEVTTGIVARFSGTVVERPDDVETLDAEQRTSVNVAVALMNRCLKNAAGEELQQLRLSLPRDENGQTVMYFYRVRNGTLVQRTPTFEAVVLSEGYYNSYVSAFNRLLWVLEKPIIDDAAKVAAVQKSIEEYLDTAVTENGKVDDDPALTAWDQILREDQVEQLFSASILPGAVKPANAASLTRSASTASPGYVGSWLIMNTAASALDGESLQNATRAFEMFNLYLSSSDAELWRKWYPQGTEVSFRVVSEKQAGATRERIADITTDTGDKRKQVSVVVEMPARAYADYVTTLVWTLGVLEVNARTREGGSSNSPGQGTGVTQVLEFLRQIDSKSNSSSAQTLNGLGVDPDRLRLAMPDVPTMFLQESPSEELVRTENIYNRNAESGAGRPRIAAHFPDGIGLGRIGADEEQCANEAVRVINLYLGKNEQHVDRAAETLRRNLAPTTVMHVYLSTSEAMNRSSSSESEVYLGVPAGYDSCAKWFLEILRVLEMQDVRLTKSPTSREAIGRSIHEFLKAYASANPTDSSAKQLSDIDIKAMTELW